MGGWKISLRFGEVAFLDATDREPVHFKLLQSTITITIN